MELMIVVAVVVVVGMAVLQDKEKRFGWESFALHYRLRYEANRIDEGALVHRGSVIDNAALEGRPESDADVERWSAEHEAMVKRRKAAREEAKREMGGEAIGLLLAIVRSSDG